MNLSTAYLGLHLKNPLVPSASPLMESVDNIRALEDIGAGAVVLHSLFEEQVDAEALRLHRHTTQGAESFAESLSYFPEPESYRFAGDDYVEHLRDVKDAVDIPVIGSLNGTSTGGWLKYARHIEEAGADAIELNLYSVPADPAVDSAALESRYIEVVRTLRSEVSIPIAVKLSPFFTSLPHFARTVVEAGANGLVLFNRFYQPDLDIDALRVRSNIVLSDSHAIRLPLRWIAILRGRVNGSLAATGGVHSSTDVIKLLMAGADVTMMCSALLRNGMAYLGEVLTGIRQWLEERDFESVEQLKGSMSQASVPDPSAFERSLYVSELQSYCK